MICATLLRCRWTAGRDGKDWTRRNQPGSGGAAHGLFLTEEGRLKKGFLVSFLVSQHGVEAPRWFVEAAQANVVRSCMSQMEQKGLGWVWGSPRSRKSGLKAERRRSSSQGKITPTEQGLGQIKRQAASAPTDRAKIRGKDQRGGMARWVVAQGITQ
jgi:hypothetical protein